MIPSSAINLPFHVADPLGVPRPISSKNFFGVTPERFFRNQFPVPSGCLTSFDYEVYRPYLGRIGRILKYIDPSWDAPALADDPPRYCFLRQGVPAEIPPGLWPILTRPPVVALRTVFQHLEKTRPDEPTIQLFDLLSIISEDVDPKLFQKVTRNRPWVKDVLR